MPLQLSPSSARLKVVAGDQPSLPATSLSGCLPPAIVLVANHGEDVAFGEAELFRNGGLIHVEGARCRESVMLNGMLNSVAAADRAELLTKVHHGTTVSGVLAVRIGNALASLSASSPAFVEAHGT